MKLEEKNILSPEGEESDFKDLLNFLKNVQKNVHIHGHAVSSEAEAQSILKHGLYTHWKALQDISHRLEESSQFLQEQIKHWQYEARHIILLIEVPKAEEYMASDVADENHNASENREKSISFAAKHVFEESTAPEGVRVSIDAKRRIPPQKIIGYWNGLTKKLHVNPAWRQKVD